MTNEVLFFITMITNFLGIILFYKLWGKYGLYVWIGVATMMANIEVVKSINIFGVEATLGNVIYGTIFLSTDILSEKYGKKSSQTGVWIGFLTLILFTLFTQINLLYIPNEYDWSQVHLMSLFSILPRITIGSLVAYIISQMIDTLTFELIKNKTGNKMLWLRNNGSTMTSQLVDTVLFTLIAFYGVFDNELLLVIGISTYLLKFIIAFFDTPFLYWAKKIEPNLK